MISRVAESCFWLHRYLERVDRTARILDVNLSFVLDSQLEDTETWWPLLVVTGEGPRFLDLHGEAAMTDGEQVQAYMTWDRRNPASILTSAHYARENARTIRESVSREMWESLNRFWLWLDDGPGKRLYNAARSDFFTHVKESVQLFRGISADTMLREEPWEFMLLAQHLERANMTARVLDVKHPMLHDGDPAKPETPQDLAQWHAVLRSCSSSEPFFKRGRPFRGGEVARFLVQDPAFPFSIEYCLADAGDCLDRIRIAPGDSVVQEEAPGGESRAALRALADRVHSLELVQASVDDLHEELTGVIESLADLGNTIHQEFFDPGIHEGVPAGAPAGAGDS